MEPQIDFDLNKIENINQIISKQVYRFNELRNLVQELKFNRVESISTYSSVSYKSIDGGKMGITFHPFEFDFIVIADSSGNEILKYLVPKTDDLISSDFVFMNDFLQIKKFLDLLNLNSIIEVSDLLKNPKIAMDLTEYACIFDKLTREKEDPIIIMKDGLLRTKAINYNHISKLLTILREFRKRKLIGVAKSSQVLNLISTALFIEGIIPHDQTGFIEIPWEIERIAYKRSIMEKRLNYAFGRLYVVKLSKTSNLLITVEIPYDFDNNELLYSKSEIYEILGHLIKDSQGSYPILGYPQTIMRAHEKAVRTGFSASIWRDKIIEKLLKEIGNVDIRQMIFESQFLREYVKKGILGGI